MDAEIIQARDTIAQCVVDLNEALRDAAELGMNVHVNSYMDTGPGVAAKGVELWHVGFEAWAPIPHPTRGARE